MTSSPCPTVNYLRLSITDRCNLRCFYCLPSQGWEKLPVQEILRYEEFLRLARVAVLAGIRKVRVTGGEPLVRKGVVDFLRRLGDTPGLEEMALTTNGVLLAEMAGDLYAAGLRHLNLSLDTLNPERYQEITGGDHFPRVLTGLWRALALGFQPLKVNCVVLKGINDDELMDFALLAREHPLQVRFIEFMPTVCQKHWLRHFLSMDEVRRRLSSLGVMEEVAPEVTAGPARIVHPTGFQGNLGFISAVSHHHCQQCNRLRLTAAGRLRPCLFSPQELDLKGPLRQGAGDEELCRLFRQAMKQKTCSPPSHLVKPAHPATPMVSIGG
jgi:cyclic pyranopterin phosphate synthase|uniref:GTP 3',8-cyclase n=1 Tax=Desulfobacca acetoxidans TaxID=60893 RepID=A0A7V6DP93_9BACT